ncbi:hypothetical protein QBC34DRAFT_405895 [Podospora aff. communis PSN243]|uniref:Pentatricopeptide repeat-containing protein n=1 Tax=Podospora aff. communis PSN243 TaxID=3040156 RepID=A0AAV9GMA4_9PEZI|nr:hypothetical protein QBC34DRAFT_405895 [Podospora aff. communis PSN243]
MQRAGTVRRPCLAALLQQEAALRLPLQAIRHFTSKKAKANAKSTETNATASFRKILLTPETTKQQNNSRPVFSRPVRLGNTELQQKLIKKKAKQQKTAGHVSPQRVQIPEDGWVPQDEAFQSQWGEFEMLVGKSPEPDAAQRRAEQLWADEDAEFDAGEDFEIADLEALDALMYPKEELPQSEESSAAGPTSQKQPKLAMKDRVKQYRRLRQEMEPDQLARAGQRFRIWKRSFGDAWKRQLLNHSLSKNTSRPFKSKDADSEQPQTGKRRALDSGEKHLLALLKQKTVPEMRAKWRAHDLERRTESWPHVMADALRLAPDRAHEILEATFEEAVVPFYAARDVASFCAKRYHLLVRGKAKEADEYGRGLLSAVMCILQESRAGYVEFTQHTLYTITKASDAEALLVLYIALRDYQHYIDPLTKLHFVSGIAKVTMYKKHAVEIFRDIEQEDLDDAFRLDSVPVMAACTTMLAFPEEDAKNPELSETRAYILEELVALGIKPNLITFTAIARNLCLAHDLENALQVFRLVKEHGITPDLHLYSVLINGCKYTGNFRVMGELVRSLAQEYKCDDPVIWNDVIHAVHYIYSVNIEHGPRVGPWAIRVTPAFQPMLQVYAKFFDLEPLQRLLPMHELRRFLSDAQDPKLAAITQGPWRAKVEGLLKVVEELEPMSLQPTTETLVIMLSGFLRSHSSVYPVVSFYAAFRRMIEYGDELATDIVQKTTAVHDNVIRYLGRWPGMLRVALDVVNDMLSAQTSTDDSSQPPKGQHPAPSIYTWSILLHALMHNKQLDQGERLLAAMRERGIEPTRVTWNTLIAGYARAQSPEDTVRAMLRAEDAGWEKDGFTLRAFRHLVHQEDALGLLEETLERRAKTLFEVSEDPTDDFKHLQQAVDDMKASYDHPVVMSDKSGLPMRNPFPSLQELRSKQWDSHHSQDKHYSLVIGQGVDQKDFDRSHAHQSFSGEKPTLGYRRTKPQATTTPWNEWDKPLRRGDNIAFRRFDPKTLRFRRITSPDDLQEEDDFNEEEKADIFEEIFEKAYEKRNTQLEMGDDEWYNQWADEYGRLEDNPDYPREDVVNLLARQLYNKLFEK